MSNTPLTKINYSDQENPILSRAFSDVVGVNYIKNSSFYDNNIDTWSDNGLGGIISGDYSWLKIDPLNNDNYGATTQIDIPLGDYVVEFDLLNENFLEKEMSIEFSNAQKINFDILNTNNIQRFKFIISITTACNSFKIISKGKSVIKIKNIFLYHRNDSGVLFRTNENKDKSEIIESFLGKNAIRFDNFKNTQGYWRKANDYGNVQQFDDHLSVDADVVHGVSALTDTILTKGKYLLQIELLPTYMQPDGKLQITLSNNQVIDFSVVSEAYKQKVLLDLVVTSDCNWIAIGSSKNNSFYLYQFYLSEKKSNVLEKIDKNESQISLINDFIISADNLIENGNFESSIDGWRANIPGGTISWDDGKMLVDSGNEDNYGVIHDVEISAGIYSLLIDIKPLFLQNSYSFKIITSENEIFSFDVENIAKKQQFIFEFLPSKNFTWIALTYSGKGRFELYNFKIYKKNNDIVNRVIDLQKQNNILGDNIIKNSNFSTSSLLWSADPGMTVTWLDSKLEINSTKANSKLIYHPTNFKLDAGKYIVSLEITPGTLYTSVRFFIRIGNDIKYFNVLNINIKQLFDLSIEVTAASENIAIGFEGTGNFYLHDFYLFRKENNVVSKLQSMQTVLTSILENQNNSDTPKSTTANITTLRTSENIIYNFLDQYTGEDIQAVETNEINSDTQVDNIIYFKGNNGNYYKRRYNYLTPEMFGAKGDGITDDYYAIQLMFDKGEEGCTFWFDGAKTYYNAFANNGLWAELLNRNMWQRKKAANFLFNGAKLRRRLPEWNDSNGINGENRGDFYTDQETALLYLEGENFFIDKADFNSGIQEGKLWDIKCVKKNEQQQCIEWEIYETNKEGYAVGTCMEYGLRLKNCKNIVINDSQFTNSVFPVYMTECENVVLNNPIFKFAAQANRCLNGGVNNEGDRALGGGIKMVWCKNVQIRNAYGYRNLNDTIEVEQFNENIFFSGMSEFDYSNSAVIIDSKHVSFDWIAKNIDNGCGVLIRGGDAKMQTKSISGRAIVDTCSYVGLFIILREGAVNDIEGINIDLQTSNCTRTGLSVNNESDDFVIKGININHTSLYDGFALAARHFKNACSGVCNGFTSNPQNNQISTYLSGTNSSTQFMRFNISLGENVYAEFVKEDPAQAYKYQKALYQDVL